ncbi:RNI-like protein, partial [Suhomyces tanzawaensis NRRL Y-17324]
MTNKEEPKAPDGSSFDLGAIRDIIENDSYLKGVKNTDVDWFLRESTVTMPLSDSLASISEKPKAKPVHNSNSLVSTTHLNTGISNSNEHNISKSKPSEPTVLSENIASSPPATPVETVGSEFSRRRKSSVSSMGSAGSTGGFFSKLKGKLGHKPEPIPKQSLFKDNYDISSNGPASTGTNRTSYDQESQAPNLQTTLHRTMSTPNSARDCADPRLNDYIKFYKQQPMRRRSSVSRASLQGELPSALINGIENPTYNKPASPEPAASSKFSSFLRKRSTTIFKELKPLKRVAFHSSTFLIDPPQQIPSRNPRKGNVEVLPGGVIKVNPLSEEDKLAIEKSQMGHGGGIVVGGSYSLGSKEVDSSVKTQTPHPSTTENNSAEDPVVDKHAKLLGIDKPMISHSNHHSTTQVKKMALDLMYTRCCHLREILPIPAMLKQIPKGSMAPLPILQLRNPTPTLVEIQTFADFIRIAPIICVSLDGVSLTFQMFKIVLSAMSAKTQLLKLSLRNTPIDNDGWSLLCWFLSRNKTLDKLDITQCPSLSVNVLKKKKKKGNEKTDEEQRMTCNKDNRSDMDWSLLVATLVARGGIGELILTGCCINDLDVFENLIKLAVLIKTIRLGLAYNQLNPKHFKIVVHNWLFEKFAAGLDLGYNDFLSNCMNKILLDYSKTPTFEAKLAKSSLAFISLNSTNLLFTDSFKQVVETIFLRLPNLKYLDFSNNQRLFGTLNHNLSSDGSTTTTSSLSSSLTDADSDPLSEKSTSRTNSDSLSEESITAYFTSKLPMFPKLVRLHLENNNFSDDSISSIAKVLPFCKYLGYFSLSGNKLDYSSLSSLIQAIKNSKSIITLDCDLDGFPDYFKEKIGLYTMRNMEKLLYKKEDSLDEAVFDSESLTEQLNIILDMKSKQKLDLKSTEVVTFINRAKNIRNELKVAIDELLKLQLKSELNLEGKETLIKFIFIDSSIEKGLQLIDNSLVETNSELIPSVIVSAEDEKNKYSLIQEKNNQITEAATGLDLPHNGGIPSSISPLNMSRSNSRSNLQYLNREEGSMLKLSRLHDYHIPNSDSADFFESLVGLSGEEIREKLMSVDFSDLDKIIEYLEQLKTKGITLEAVFNLTEQQQQEQEQDPFTDGTINDAYDQVLNILAKK